MVGGTALIEGLPKAVEELLKIKVIVPPNAQYIGAVGAALLASGFISKFETPIISKNTNGVSK
jgi:activator of 2-hydroxyglutaryl-CoA dehydratase